MKCTNNLRAAVLLLVCVMMAGCGTKDAALERTYDIYHTTLAAGGTSVASSGGGGGVFFSEDLCVAPDVEIGTDATTSNVAEGAGVFNLATKTVTYEKNIYQKLYPASTTKILTAYLVLKYCDDLGTITTVSENAADQATDSSVCGLNAGDIISMRDLLYGLMLRSGNDAAIVLAEQISGSVEQFVELMNQEALAMGATQSHFANPNGLPAEGHYTSVYDLYLMFQEAVKDERFLEIIGTTAYNVSYQDAAGNTIEKVWENTNQYFTGYATPPEGITIVGGKTGTTGEAGYCLVLYTKNQKGEPIISIVLKADGKADLYLLMNEMLGGYAM